MDFVASMDICGDLSMFESLNTKGDIQHFRVGNIQKVKADVVGFVRLKLQNVDGNSNYDIFTFRQSQHDLVLDVIEAFIVEWREDLLSVHLKFNVAVQ